MRPAVLARLSSVVLLACTPLVACSYGPEFRRDTPGPRSHGPVPVVHAEPRLRIALGRCAIEDVTEQRLFERLWNAIRADANVGAVLPGDARASSVDERILVHVERHARTTPVNFAVAWPGIYVDAPYWHGFEWPYKVKTTVVLERPDGTVIAERHFFERYLCYYTPPSYSATLGTSWLLGTLPSVGLGWIAATAEKPPNLETIDRRFAKDEGPFWARRISDELVREVVRDRESGTRESASRLRQRPD